MDCDEPRAKSLFASLPIDGKILEAIEGDMNLSEMTAIQQMSIHQLLDGKDIIATAKTGSGKTLAFLIPIIQKINMKLSGLQALVICPTRELSIQTFNVLKELVSRLDPKPSCGIAIGGTSRQDEARRLTGGKKGDFTVSIIVCTPGRLLDHIMNTAGFNFRNLRMLILDEADRILDIGFEEDLKSIFNKLPVKKRQTCFFSATLSEKLNDMAKLAMQNRHEQALYISANTDDNVDDATVSSLVQGYAIVPIEKRFLLLYTFLKKNEDKKVIVFLSSCLSVKFHNELLNFIDIAGVKCIHGRQKQAKRTSTFLEFCQASKGILICTDVAARGLDIPAVDWIVQYDPPDDPKEYIHRVGRTARAGASGNALLMLAPSELGLLRYLRVAGVSSINEFKFSWSKIANVQNELENIISKNYFLHMAGRDAYKSYVRAYASHHLKDIYNISRLDLKQVAKSFGFIEPPYVNLDVGAPSKRKQKNMMAAQRDKKQKKQFTQSLKGRKFVVDESQNVQSV
ncbi:hypothetical protein GJ496_002069 [Pomphorhynchus laevis]|nr:hypothetical protein GJ496_002069 [Pomphorhynchus laevis]